MVLSIADAGPGDCALCHWPAGCARSGSRCNIGVIARDEQSPVGVPVPLSIPEIWAGEYAARVDWNSVYFDYVVDP